MQKKKKEQTVPPNWPNKFNNILSDAFKFMKKNFLFNFFFCPKNGKSAKYGKNFKALVFRDKIVLKITKSTESVKIENFENFVEVLFATGKMKSDTLEKSSE